MLDKSIPVSKHPKSESNHLSKCTNSNSNSNSNSHDVSFWPPSPAVIDGLISKLKDRDGDMESNWEKIILNFKKELDLEHQQELEEEEEEEVHQLKPQPSCSGVGGGGGGGGCGGGSGVRAKFSVPLSRREMEKDFEDMGERRLPRKPKKRPKVVQNQLDTLFPGLWLTEIHADLYRVSETKKR